MAKRRSSSGSGPERMTDSGRPGAPSGGAQNGRLTNVDPEVRRRMIAEAAYHRAANRGFCPGAEVEDCRWSGCYDCGVCPGMGTDIQIGPTGRSLLPLTVVQRSA